MNKGVAFLLKKNKVDVIWGEARIAKAPDPASAQPGEVTVAAPSRQAVEPQHSVPAATKGAGTYGAHHIIVATGARPRTLPGIAPDGQNIWTYFEAMKPVEMPKSLIVIGSGAIGIEFAYVLANYGVASGMTREQGDLDGDTDVDLTDLSILLGVFGTTCP